MPYEAQRRAVRVEHLQLAVEHQDDVLDLLHEAPHALQLAHVGERAVPTGELRKPALQRLAPLEVGRSRLASRSSALVAHVAARDPVEHLEAAAVAAVRRALDVIDEHGLVDRAARQQRTQRAEAELALAGLGRKAGRVRPDRPRVSRPADWISTLEWRSRKRAQIGSSASSTLGSCASSREREQPRLRYCPHAHARGEGVVALREEFRAARERETQSERSARSSTANRRVALPVIATGISALRSARSLTVAESPELSSR